MRVFVKVRLAVAVLGTTLAFRLPAAPTGPELIVRGTFTWSNEDRQKHELHAKLTPTGPNEWQAVWDFKWKRRPMTFNGSVKGDLRNGLLAGTGEIRLAN